MMCEPKLAASRSGGGKQSCQTKYGSTYNRLERIIFCHNFITILPNNIKLQMLQLVLSFGWKIDLLSDMQDEIEFEI